MVRTNRIYIWLVAIWLLMFGGVVSPVRAYQQVNYSNHSSIWQKKTVLSNERYPSYHFQSTSSYAPIVGQTSYTADTYDPMQNAAPNRARKSSPWDEDPQDDDDSYLPIGVTDNPLPIGEPWALFGMLICYLFYTKRKKIQKKFAQFRKM